MFTILKTYPKVKIYFCEIVGVLPEIPIQSLCARRRYFAIDTVIWVRIPTLPTLLEYRACFHTMLIRIS